MDLSNTKLSPTTEIELRVPTDIDLVTMSERVFEPDNFEHVVKYTGYTKDIKTPANYLKYKLEPRLEETKKGEELMLFIYIKGQIAGRLSAHEIDYRNKKTEFGYYLLSGYSGKGVMTKCIKALEKFVFEELGLNRIELTIDPDNKPSIALANKLNYIHEGTLRQSYFNHYLNEQRDDMIFSKLKSDSEAQTR